MGNRKLLVIGVCVVVVLGLLALTFGTKKSAPNTPASTFIPLTAPATLLKAESLYTKLGVVRYDQVRSDLNQYSRDYKKTTDADVVFEVSNAKGSTTTASFVAIYQGQPAYTLEVSVKILNNSRIGLSFKDKNTGDTSFDTKLSSNSKRNAFIGTLPVDKNTFQIDFTADDDTFVVSLGERSQAARNQADAYLTEMLGDITNEKINYLVPGSGVQ